jgi:hypothetical protein
VLRELESDIVALRAFHTDKDAEVGGRIRLLGNRLLGNGPASVTVVQEGAQP